MFQLLLRSLPGLMGEHYKRFFCGYAEPAYIKQRKMQVNTPQSSSCHPSPLNKISLHVVLMSRSTKIDRYLVT